MPRKFKLIWGATRDGEVLGTFDDLDEKGINMCMHEKLEKLHFTSHYMRSWTDPMTGDKIFDYGSHTNFFWLIYE
jgi:hypothetical protein